MLLWTAEGKTAWEVGRIIGVTEGTARVHLAHALDKLQAVNKAHAVAKGFAVGIIARKLILALLVGSGFTVHTDAEASRVPKRPTSRLMRSAAKLAGFKGRP